MASQQGAVVAAGIERRRGPRWAVRRALVMTALGVASANADPASDAAILGTSNEGPKIDEVRLRMTSYYQDGHGYQSLAGPLSGPGSERALILQPMALIGVRQSSRIHHELVVPVDIVSAASVNAVDVVSHASGVNEAIGVELTSRFDASHQDQLVTRLAWHEEEPFGSGSFGLGYTRSLAEDNATLGISGQATFDRFDFLQRNGDRYGRRNRTTLNGNLSLSQLLSATTVFDASYGLTLQRGTLQTTYNNVPLASGRGSTDEIFPHSRSRSAFQARFAQHLPVTHSTLRAAYRFYFDSFELSAHTLEFELHQYLTQRFIARGSYRYYTQTGVDFFTTGFVADGFFSQPRTADSDLARFHGSEFGLKLLWLAPGKSTLDVSWLYYARSNDFRANIISFGYGDRF